MLHHRAISFLHPTENKHVLFCLIFFFSLCNCGAVLRGPGLLAEHCTLENRAGVVTMFPQVGALCSVNGSPVEDACRLTQGKPRPSHPQLHGKADGL